MFELIGIELLFERWLKADMQIHGPIDDDEKRRKFKLFQEIFFWAWATEKTGLQLWLGQKASCRWAYSDARLLPGQGLVPRDPLGR